MTEHNCLYCKGSGVGIECNKFGTPTGKIGKCYSCSGTGKQKFRFDTCKEAREWQKSHPIGLYKENAIWLGECREELEIYLQSHETGIPWQDLYDVKYNILRFEI